jgi:riboflavin synthase
MFTGLIESVVTLRSITMARQSCCLVVDLGRLAEDAKLGDSFALNGVCLTVTTLQGTVAGFDVSNETVSKSTIGSLKPNTPINIERALRLGDRMGGHIVQGHVDGTGRVAATQKQGDFLTLNVSLDRVLLEQMVEKGSVAVDGISLTIATLQPTQFSVAVIPETLRNTTLHTIGVGEPVNIEIDVISKTVRRYLDTMLSASGTLTVDKLRQFGF